MSILSKALHNNPVSRYLRRGQTIRELEAANLELQRDWEEDVQTMEELSADLISLADKYKLLETERDKYKPFHDALMDEAVVNWTYTYEDEHDYRNAIRKLIQNRVAMESDPVINQAMAKVTEERDALKARLGRIIDSYQADADSACYCNYNQYGERTLMCEYHEGVQTAKAIAEGE